MVGMTRRPGDWLSERPAALVALLVGVQVGLWTLVPVLTYQSLPLDVIENLLWGREWQWGYDRHPPLQAWLVQASLMVSDGADWGPYLAAQLVVAVTYLALFLLARDLGGPVRAALGVLLFSLVYYAHIPTPELNANTVQMPVWAIAGLALWRALERERLIWWLILGVALAVALYGKYSVIFLVGALTVAVLSHPAGLRALTRRGPWLGAALALALAAPHLVWLVDSGGQPIAFALSRSAPLTGWERLTSPAMFLLAQLANHAGTLLVLALGLALAWRRRRANGNDALPQTTEPGGVAVPARNRRYVLVLAVVPLAGMVLYSVTAGGALRDMWGMPMVLWISPALALALPEPMARRVIAAVAGLWLALITLLPLGAGAAATWGPALSDARPLRVSWPGETVARSLADIWARETGGLPLTLVGGDTWRSGLVLHYGGVPAEASGFIGLDPLLSPWVAPDRIAREGLLVVWPGDHPPPRDPPGPVTAQGVLEVPFPGAPDHLATTAWAVIAPRADGS